MKHCHFEGKTGSLLLEVLLCCVVSACAARKPTLYEAWSARLTEMGRSPSTSDDVSLLLSSPPHRCDELESSRPLIGLRYDRKEAVVTRVFPASPAWKAGIRVGDKIESVDSRDASTTTAVLAVTNREGEPIEVRTQRGTYSVVPELPDLEQCYWDVGEESAPGLGAPQRASEDGRSGDETGSARKRFFRASCRFYNGWVDSCRANWKE